jgi:hypothetical protein
MKATCLLTDAPLSLATELPAFVLALPPRESIRHILLGSPGAVQQTIHLLHRLHYCETGLWSPVMAVVEPVMITPAQGEAMSLLRRQV